MVNLFTLLNSTKQVIVILNTGKFQIIINKSGSSQREIRTNNFWVMVFPKFCKRLRLLRRMRFSCIRYMH